MGVSSNYLLLVAIAILVLLPTQAEAFGAGNIASISKIEGKNWRHGDIEDMLATVACLKGHKWKSNMIKRVYFGNWLRDYSQAVDTATLAKVQAETIRVLVWVLSFMSFGYATGEFEVTAERLGVYRPEEHIDNPKDYADNVDARKFDPRLRPPVTEAELAVDPQTGMKNYIANERGGWATSTGYVKFSFARAIHFGRLYTHGPSGQRGREEDLAEALRCLGQGLHCLEDFGAHTNYTELVLRELGYHEVFPHVGVQAGITLNGKHVYPLVTGTFGGVDFFHSVLGEATDHITSSEIDEVNTALVDAVSNNTSGKRGPGGESPACSGLIDALSKVPGTGNLIQEAQQLQAASDAQAAANARSGGYDNYGSRAGGQGGYQQTPSFDAPPGSDGGPPGPNIPGTNTDPATIIPKIYPILVFRDNVVRSISAIISKIPGLEKLIETITERVTLFVLSLLAPFILPIIKTASAQLKSGSSAVIDAAAKHQYEVWTIPTSTDPTHSMLSKDHFSNVLNEPAGQVAVAILQYVAPRVIYAWDHPDVPVDQVLNDCMRVFHHPGLRDPRCEVHNTMYECVKKWAHNYRGKDLNHILSSESVRAGKNHSGEHDHSHGAHAHGAAGMQGFSGHSHGGGHSSSGGGHSGGHGGGHGGNSHQQSGSGGLLGSITGNLPGGLGSAFNNLNLGGGGRTREAGDYDASAPGGAPYQPPPSPQPSQWGNFQPYQSNYSGEGYQPPAEYSNAAPSGGYGWGQGEFSGGQGAEPSYTVPTAYQQGYENYGGAGPGGYEQPPPQEPHTGGYSYDQNPPTGGSGRQWGGGGGNAAW
ncbi:heterokaryon incompatibility protein Het-C-domain-containing protein [Paraphoma chrysanthemicola]|uniref:Heterokaryon incompatibility protein Het-C-domain-containing protein n=1 Tax=Paraphoma chrysanthemicola TaxID=798071 RepID=A0A8K0W5I8_9PLEO|nr:heterokaryon incompatibility protein Het-C-domain-containing protein [Paraphoma chrysanthemicola]